MKTLYLAQFTLVKERYDQLTREDKITRLIWAVSRNDAESILRDEYNSYDSSGGQTRFYDLTLSEALGTLDNEI